MHASKLSSISFQVADLPAGIIPCPFKMKLLVVSLLLSLFAISSARSNCFEEKTDACDEMLLEAMFGDSSEEDACRKMEDGIKCVEEKAKECESEEDTDVQEALASLNNILKIGCEGYHTYAGEKLDNVEHDDNAQLTQCFEDNEDYIQDCLVTGSIETLEAASERENGDDNFIKCSMFNEIAGCFVQRLGEKCGEGAQKLADREFNDVPAEIVDACKAANIEKTSIQLLGEYKKKK